MGFLFFDFLNIFIIKWDHIKDQENQKDQDQVIN